MKPLRIGLVGAGLIGETHSVMLNQIADGRRGQVELVAAADVDPARRNLLVDRYRYGRGFATGEELLDAVGLDALFVCTPTRFHAETVRRAAARGVHVFCEKPAAMSHAEGLQMLEAVRAGGVQCQIGLVLRFSPVYAVVRELLAAEEAREPMAVVLRDDQCFPIRGLHHTPWRNDPAFTAGGTLIEHGVHDLDLLTWFFGQPRSLRGWVQNHAGQPGVEDYVAVEIEFAGGLRAQLINVWHDMAQRPSNRRLEIFCRRAFIASEHDMLGEVLFQSGDGAVHTIHSGEVLSRFEAALPRVDPAFAGWYAIPYFVQDLAFVDALLEDRPVFPDLALGLEAQRLAEEVYRSAREGVEVVLGA